VGLGASLTASGDAAGADAAFGRAAAAMEALRRGGRTGEATLAAALHHAAGDRRAEAIQCLETLLDRADLPFTGWTIPIEPLLDPLREDPGFQRVTARLAERAR
jgi:hypothetical protein